MAIAPTRFSRVSVGWVSSDESIVDKDAADTGASFSVIEGNWAIGATTVTSSAAELNLLDGVTAIGFDAVSTITGTVDLGSVAANASVSSTVAFSGVAEGDTVVVTPESAWSGDYYSLCLSAHPTAADVVTLVASNTSTGAIDPAAVTMRFTAFSMGDFE